MRRFAAVCLAVLFAVAIVPPLPAQQSAERPGALADGRHSLAFSVPRGGGTRFGYWRMISDRTNLGVNAGLEFGSSRSDREGADRSWSWGFSVMPAIKRYMDAWGPVVPHVYASVGGGHMGNDGASDHWWSLRGSGGIGVEWFPVDRVSIGGHTGAQLVYANPEVGSDPVANVLRLSTTTSALTLHVYFGGPEESEPGVASTP